MLLMHSCGGMSGVLHFPISQEWLLTISVFVVCAHDFMVTIYLNLLMAATSIDVEHLFSHGRLLLSHVHSHLSPQSVHVLLCLCAWCKLGLVKDDDVLAVAAMPDIPGDDDMELEDSWDIILLD